MQCFELNVFLFLFWIRLNIVYFQYFESRVYICLIMFLLFIYLFFHPLNIGLF